jgi:phosphotransferase system  glucose/maltose/N-acetylglucosamine-specific IIC component
MEVSAQFMFNGVLAFAGAIGLFILNAVWSKLSALEANDKTLTVAIYDLKVLVSGEYVKSTEINPMLQAIFKELQDINKELSNKAERRDVP